MSVPLLHFDYGGKGPGRAGLSHPSIAPYGAFATRTGQQVVVSVQNEREWRNFCTSVLQDQGIAEDERFSSNSRRCANRAALDGTIAAVFAQIDQAEAIARLEQGNIAWARLNEVDGLSAHTQLRRIQVDTPTGPAAIPAPPARWNGEEPRGLPVPGLHAHDAAVRAEFR
jgi:itaconate CoA-transferase